MQKKHAFSHDIRGDATYASLGSQGRFLLTASSRDNSIFTWDLENNIELQPLSGHEEPISKVKFISDGLIITSSLDGFVRLWHSYPWKEISKTLNAEELNSKDQTKQLQDAVSRTLLNNK